MTISLEDKKIFLETGHVANNADQSLVLRFEKNYLLFTVTLSKEPIEEDFLPLNVIYQEKLLINVN